MAMLGESMYARPDGVADHRPSIASAVCIGASHDLDIGQSVMRLPVAARLAVTRPRAAKQTDVIRSEGLATDFDTSLYACRDIHAACGARIALQQEKMNAARKALPCERHKFAARRSLYVAVPDGAVPGIARMWRASDNCWK
ncbi:hypothetical protein [Bradyrhizobium genosp. A]|uniref:hypothetical protein n=1 Tax=Bradyrhizobium genosp. A TaxID=83626 RepID=UPI003CE867F6